MPLQIMLSQHYDLACKSVAPEELRGQGALLAPAGLMMSGVRRTRRTMHGGNAEKGHASTLVSPARNQAPLRREEKKEAMRNEAIGAGKGRMTI